MRPAPRMGMASWRRMRQVRLRRSHSLQSVPRAEVDGELSVYKSVPPPREAGGGAGGATIAGRPAPNHHQQQQLPGSDSLLNVNGAAQLTSVSVHLNGHTVTSTLQNYHSTVTHSHHAAHPVAHQHHQQRTMPSLQPREADADVIGPGELPPGSGLCVETRTAHRSSQRSIAGDHSAHLWMPTNGRMNGRAATEELSVQDASVSYYGGGYQRGQTSQAAAYPETRDYNHALPSSNRVNGFSGAAGSVPQQRAPPPSAYAGNAHLRPAGPRAPRPAPPPAYGTRLPPPGQFFHRQGSQGRYNAPSSYYGDPTGTPRSPGAARATAAPSAQVMPAPSVSWAHPAAGPHVPDVNGPTDGLDERLRSHDLDPRSQLLVHNAGVTTGTEADWLDSAENELSDILDRHPSASAPLDPTTPPLPALNGSPPTSPRMSRGLPDRLSGAGDGGTARRSTGQSQDKTWMNSQSQPRAGDAAAAAVAVGTARTTNQSRQRTNASAAFVRGASSVPDMARLPAVAAGLDLDSLLDPSSDQSTEEGSTLLDAGGDAPPTVRRQLHSLETMYSEVLRLLGSQRRAGAGGRGGRAAGGRARPAGSVSSLPSSIGGRPARERRRDDRRQLRDARAINKRFQRLESHVVTLARSVAHLSSEMRTQHLMFQEMEAIRSELAQLRTGGAALGRPPGGEPGTTEPGHAARLAHPARVRKLTRFFGDEPPLLRIFLTKLGYEKYAPLFEREGIGMLELPHLSEERMQKLGVPAGPRLRILHQAQAALRAADPHAANKVYIL